MAKSNYLEQKVLDYIFNGSAFASPATYVSLYTTDPTDADSGTEVSGTNYARQLVDVNGGSSPTWNLAVVDGIGYLVDNAAAITFPTAGAGGWGTVSHFGIHDALTVGNLLYHGALTASQTVNDGSTFEFAIGDLNIREE